MVSLAHASRVSGERDARGSRAAAPRASVRLWQHVDAYLDCIKDVGLSRINWKQQT